jgi:hypothetical protein
MEEEEEMVVVVVVVVARAMLPWRHRHVWQQTEWHRHV